MQISLKHWLFFSSVFVMLTVDTCAQLSSGFNKTECMEMMALCCSFTFLDLYNDDSQIIPDGYEKIYNSKAIAMDNMYQLYKKGDTAVICFRGSTTKRISWLANFHVDMLPAKGRITGDLGEIDYCFSNAACATVHGGYAIAIAHMSSDLKEHILKLHYQGVKDVIITGHSQGGALANLMTALLDHHINDSLINKVRYKTYSFAAPMVGNNIFVEDYNSRFCVTGYSYNIENIADFVPQLPVRLNDENVVAYYLESCGTNDHPSLKKLIEGILISMFRNALTNDAIIFSAYSRKQFEMELGKNVEFPDVTHEIYYDKLDNVIELDPFEFPEILKDSSFLEKRSYQKWVKNGKQNQRKKNRYYKKGRSGYQHKPYNYYVNIIRKYFPEDYNKLDIKYLPENL